MRRYVDGMRSRLLQQAAGWKGDVHYQEAAVRGGPESSEFGGADTEHAGAGGSRLDILVARQGSFGLLEAAARRHTRERIAREWELAMY